ncbi:CubicO group peptidase (beta-lactamase class C family) [Chitinophagaceae bacterium OAS944]|nr:CubicO group peptidase (beta-lactamase class C family) [Chitinophagaceae bacterium OAS944]
MATDNPLRSSMDTLVQNILVDFMADTSRAGLSLGIIKNGKIYTYNYGTIRKGHKVLPVANSIYEIGSISKTNRFGCHIFLRKTI